MTDPGEPDDLDEVGTDVLHAWMVEAIQELSPDHRVRVLWERLDEIIKAGGPSVFRRCGSENVLEARINAFMAAHPGYDRGHVREIAEFTEKQGIPWCCTCADWHEPQDEHSVSDVGS